MGPQQSIVSNTQPSMIHKKSLATQQMRPLSHETQPLVATGLAQHGFPLRSVGYCAPHSMP